MKFLLSTLSDFSLTGITAIILIIYNPSFFAIKSTWSTTLVE